MTPLAPHEKACSRCQQVKPRTEFYGNHTRRDGLQDACKPCSHELTRPRASAYARALAALREMHRDDFDLLYRVERGLPLTVEEIAHVAPASPTRRTWIDRWTDQGTPRAEAAVTRRGPVPTPLPRDAAVSGRRRPG